MSVVKSFLVLNHYSSKKGVLSEVLCGKVLKIDFIKKLIEIYSLCPRRPLFVIPAPQGRYDIKQINRKIYAFSQGHSLSDFKDIGRDKIYLGYSLGKTHGNTISDGIYRPPRTVKNGATCRTPTANRSGPT